MTAGLYKTTPVLQGLPDVTVAFAALTLAACIHAIHGHASTFRFASFVPLFVFFGLMLSGVPLSASNDGLNQWIQFFTLTLLATTAPLFLIRRNDQWVRYLLGFMSLLGLFFTALVLSNPGSVSLTGRYVALTTNTIQTSRLIGVSLICLFILTFRRRVHLLVALAFGAPMTYALVGTGSRGPLLAAMISVTVALHIGGRSSLAPPHGLATHSGLTTRRGLAKRAGLLLGLVLLLYLGYLNAPMTSQARIFEIGESGDTRLVAWRVTLEGIVSYPLGVGSGNWQQFADRVTAGELVGVGHPHNIVLLTFIEWGWLAGAGLLWFLARCYRSALRGAMTTTGQAVFAVFIYFLLNSFVSGTLNDSRITLTMCGVVLAREALRKAAIPVRGTLGETMRTVSRGDRVLLTAKHRKIAQVTAAAASSPTWRPLLGAGLSEDPRSEWMWRHVQSVLGLEVDGPVAICWGTEPLPAGVVAAVRVPRDRPFLAVPERLVAAFEVLRHVDAAHSKVEAGGREAEDRGSGDGELRLPVDVFAWVDWLVSRTEEYGGHTPDDLGNFPREESLLSRAGLSEQPAADQLICALREAVEVAALSAGIAVRRTTPWPAGKRFAVCLSHDIDYAVRQSATGALRKLAGAAVALSQRDRRTALRRADDAIGLLRGNAASPYWLMDPMAAREDERGYRSTFFVLPHTQKVVPEGPDMVTRYDVGHPDVQQMLRRLSAGGWELGLHISYDAHDDGDGVARDWSLLRDVVPAGVNIAGARSHYLRLRMPDTLRQEEEAGIPYDATMGWRTGWGFRSGSAMPYQPFDVSTGRVLGLWELDLHLMDVSVPLDDYLSLLGVLLERVRSVGGCASVLVHPSPCSNFTAAQHLELYDRVLDQIAGYNDAWVTTPSAVVGRMTDYVRRLTAEG